jgi:4-hydroxy-L-threonine phosphate dehydrogenase PdxA
VTGRRTIALPIGDPNGIGPDIAVKAAVRLIGRDDLRVVLFGDRFVIEHYAAQAGARVQNATQPIAEGAETLFVRPVEALVRDAFVPGQVSAEAGRATVAYVSAAVAEVRQGRADAIVACPHSETAINQAGIAFAGYPGLIARLAGLPEDRVFLMLVGGGLRIVHVTLHESVAHALARLTPDLVEAAALAAITTLQAQGIARPRIGLFGINPHAGEGGLFGAEDANVTEPAAARLRGAGHDIEGPAGGDLLLGRDDLDAYVAIFHDQGHIPIKLLAGRSASALSIGAGLIFSSVGHGAAFDIAGKGHADPSAVLRTIRLLADAPGAPSAAVAADGAR